MKLLLVGRQTALVRAWRSAFGDIQDAEVIEGDYFERAADAMVSPANSFGIMDGGIDLAIRDTVGFAVQRRVQQVIVERHHGELPVGCAEIVETEHDKWPYLVVAPTMRVPGNVAQSLNAYLAFRAAVLACVRHGGIRSITCCGLATGIGGMAPTRCAVQMRMAWRHATGPARIPSFAQIHAVNDALVRS